MCVPCQLCLYTLIRIRSTYVVMNVRTDMFTCILSATGLGVPCRCRRVWMSHSRAAKISMQKERERPLYLSVYYFLFLNEMTCSSCVLYEKFF